MSCERQSVRGAMVMDFRARFAEGAGSAIRSLSGRRNRREFGGGRAGTFKDLCSEQKGMPVQFGLLPDSLCYSVNPRSADPRRWPLRPDPTTAFGSTFAISLWPSASSSLA